MSWTRYSRSDLGNKAPPLEEVPGWFAEIGDRFLALYVLRGSVRFVLEDQTFVLSSTTTVQVSGPISNRELSVWQDGKESARVKYTLEAATPVLDPTAFVESEDTDFGQFVNNISASPERQRVLLDLHSVR
jgi:hypothetical protein